MGLRFRRSIRLMPGVRINLSRSGLSMSIGVRGAHVTVGHSKVRETIGLPGAGLSYTTTQSTGGTSEEVAGARPRDRIGRVLLWILAAIFLIPILIGAIVMLFGK